MSECPRFTPASWDWFDNSPRGETYGVRIESEVLCYTNRTKQGYEDAIKIAAAWNTVLSIETYDQCEKLNRHTQKYLWKWRAPEEDGTFWVGDGDRKSANSDKEEQ